MNHYDGFLADHYDWMCGGFDSGLARAQDFFARHGLACPLGKALDLGCGSGFQSLALARLGMAVTAVDNSPRMLEILRTRKAAHGASPNDYPGSIRALCADMLDAAAWADGGVFDLAICMGDSLAHLPNMDAVRQCLQQMREHLAPQGWLALTFRDQTEELSGADRIIPLRLDPDRLMTTVLDYSPGTVTVHDVVHSREQGQWNVTKSSYVKTRLRTHEISEFLDSLSMRQVHSSLKRGMAVLVYANS
ncbi:MAG: class I SAM-dependent methyltransferase [Desulfovibrio sp.]|uniref:class I SAM-dependent methyltransferase n=1 Tax=Desulfovibrio sp. 7SRBS1 TaxID=3378064 RepID=UPI003B41BC08